MGPFLIGFGAGAFGALLGLGGGVLIVPALTGILRLSQHDAHGTSLVAVALTAVVGSLTYAAGGSVDWVAAVLLAATAMLAARLGARATRRLQARTLRRVFGAFLLGVAFLLPFKHQLPHVRAGGAGMLSWVILLLAGGLAGFLSGLLGVGGGTVMVPALVLGDGLDQHLAQGTSLAAMVLPSLIGAYTHWTLGHVRRKVVPGLLAGVLLGAYLGGRLALGIPEFLLRTLFAVILVWMALRYLRA